MKGRGGGAGGFVRRKKDPSVAYAREKAGCVPAALRTRYVVLLQRRAAKFCQIWRKLGHVWEKTGTTTLEGASASHSNWESNPESSILQTNDLPLRNQVQGSKSPNQAGKGVLMRPYRSQKGLCVHMDSWGAPLCVWWKCIRLTAKRNQTHRKCTLGSTSA